MIEEKSSLFEGAIGAVGAVIVFASTLSAPRLSVNMSREELARDGVQKTQRIEVLQTWLKTAQQGNDSLRAQLASTGSLLEEARAEIGSLTEERNGLKTQVASKTGQLKEVDGQLQELKQEMAKFKEFISFQQVAGERDEALDRAKKAEERIRELTLQLNRAGVWP
jgi:chromosome segregation ATPase